jgi:flagellar basal-body rod modification protein FlgD
MTTDSISAASASVAASTTKAGSSTSPQISQQQFLTLFIEQLKNQDPLSPMQPDQLTAQLAQFSSLEQLTGINTRLDTLAGSAKQTTGSAMLALLGKQVSIDGGRLAISHGHVPTATYQLAQAAEKVTATVRDADGKAVRVVDLGAKGAGQQTFIFDGKDGQGQTLVDGTYALEITAAAKGDKAPTPVSTQTLATIDGVDLESDSPALLVGGTRVPLDQVREVHEPASGA